MIALGTNVLVYAHRPESRFHGRAKEVVAAAAQSPAPWAIPFHCLVELAAVVTNPRIFATPSSPAEVRRQIEAWRKSPSLRLLTDDTPTLETLFTLGEAGRTQGGRWHDARIAACCLAHGVAELWTADRDYSSFPFLRTRNPLVGT